MTDIASVINLINLNFDKKTINNMVVINISPNAVLSPVIKTNTSVVINNILAIKILILEYLKLYINKAINKGNKRDK